MTPDIYYSFLIDHFAATIMTILLSPLAFLSIWRVFISVFKEF